MKKFLIAILMIASISVGCGNSAGVAEKSDKLEAAEVVAEPVVEDADYYIKLAKEKMQERPPTIKGEKDALEYANNAVKLAPKNPVAHYVQGQAKFNLGRFGQACYSFERAIKLNPNYVEAYYSLGATKWIINRKEDLPSAIEDLNKVLEFNPNHDGAYYYRGLCHRSMKEFDKAIENFNQAIELNAKFVAAAYHQRGVCYQEIGDEESAQADLAKAKELGYKL